MDRYAAEAMAKINVLLAPWAAFAMAVRMKRFERAEVERARHVAIVKGLKRKLESVSQNTHFRMTVCAPCCNGQTAPPQVLPRGCEEPRRHILAALCNLHEGIGTQKVHHCV